MTRGGHDAQSTGKEEASEIDDREQGGDKFEAQKGEHGAFSGRSESHTFAGFLFDLDGTIINTTDAVTRHWNKIGAELGVDPKAIMDSSRGRRSIDIIKLYDPSKANWEYVSQIESLIPKEYGSSASETPGARRLLQSLSDAGAPWALVTSCTRALLQAWLERMALPAPPVAVAAEDVSGGKPHPACYKLGRQRVGVGEQARVLVVEDSPSGVAAGKAAGCVVLGLATTHRVEQLRIAGADCIVKDLNSVQLVDRKQGEYTICLGNKWVEDH